MKKLYSPKLIIPYLLLGLVFYYFFGVIEKDYINPDCMHVVRRNYPIDSRVGDTLHLSTGAYVAREGGNCYIVSGYFKTFFPLDMAFPVAYSLLFLSVGGLLKNTRLRKILLITIVLGAAWDYLEDFSFAIFLTTHLGAFAGITAFFTNIKTVFIVANVVTCILILLGRGVGWVRRRLFYWH